MNVVKFGEHLTGNADVNAEPSISINANEGVESGRQPSRTDEGAFQTTKYESM